MWLPWCQAYRAESRKLLVRPQSAFVYNNTPQALTTDFVQDSIKSHGLHSNDRMAFVYFKLFRQLSAFSFQHVAGQRLL